jgi:hypothetical protein
MGAIGVLCQLEAEAGWQAELRRWLPGLTSRRGTRRASGAAGS